MPSNQKADFFAACLLIVRLTVDPENGDTMSFRSIGKLLLGRAIAQAVNRWLPTPHSKRQYYCLET
jgi:hypothetical protein